MNTQFREEIDCHNKHNITEMKEHNSYLTTIYVPYQGFSSVELKSQLSTNVKQVFDFVNNPDSDLLKFWELKNLQFWGF